MVGRPLSSGQHLLEPELERGFEEPAPEDHLLPGGERQEKKQASSGHGRVLEGGKLLSAAAFPASAASFPVAALAPALRPFASAVSSSSSISSSLVPGFSECPPERCATAFSDAALVPRSAGPSERRFLSGDAGTPARGRFAADSKDRDCTDWGRHRPVLVCLGFPGASRRGGSSA